MQHNTQTEDSLAEPCIGALEKHLHDVFAATLSPGEDFVYVQDAALFTALDEYCDEQSMGTTKPPLLVTAWSGGGKSALLANWKLRHERQGQRTRSAAQHKFIFWHAVGCSRPSIQVHAMLRRLMTELAEYFDIARPVPKDDERLSWDLPRFLELAAKKGQVILLLDGVQNLSAGNAESGFKWLPLVLPPNVRVILSATVHTVQDGEPNEHSLPKQPRVLLELERRRWQQITLAPLTREVSASIIEAHLKKTAEGDLGLASHTFLTAAADPRDVPMPPLKGLLLFQRQIDSILSHPASNNPLFLRILLRSLHWGAAKGYDLWSLVDTLSNVVDATSLLKAVIRVFSIGSNPQEEDIKSAEARSADEGGLEHLRLRYSWHPYFQLLTQMETQATDSRRNLKHSAMRGQSIRDVPVATKPSESISAVLSLGNSVVGNIGDQNWIRVKEEAEKKLEQARADVETDIQSLLESASAMAEQGNKSLFDALWEHQSAPTEGVPESQLFALTNLESTRTANRSPDSSPTSTRRTRYSSGDTNSEGIRSGRSIHVELPVYLRGGTFSEGFGALVGNALALLYVARLGLKEVELWSILARLRRKKSATDIEYGKPGTEDEAVLAKIYPIRGQLVDRLRLHDVRKSGYVTGVAIRNTAMTLLQTERFPKVGVLLRALGFASSIEDSDDTVLVRYVDFAQRCERQLRACRRNRLTSRRQKNRRGQAIHSLSVDDEPLDPDVEDELLSLLCALGILHSPENQVLVLPLGSSVLREAVRELFVPDETAEAQWHIKLIQYFHECGNSLRRCEELPWHLQQCRRWQMLRDTLVDLNTFELMFRTRLRAELLQYWRLLTQGPMYVSDAAEARASEALSTDASEKLLSMLDTSLVFGYTREQASQLAMAGQQAPFDIVQEYNAALEQWEQDIQPTIQHLVAMQETIAAMLVEFGKSLVGTSLPTFLRVYPRADHLRAIDVHELPGAVAPCADNLVHQSEGVERPSDTEDLAASADTGTGSAITKAEQSAQQLAQTLYDYHRWMWIQIPWLALRSVIATHLSPIDSHRSNGSVSYRTGAHHGQTHDDASTVPTRQSAVSETRKYWELKKYDPRDAPETPKLKSTARPPTNKLVSSVKEQIKQITGARSKPLGALPSVAGSKDLRGFSTAESDSLGGSLAFTKSLGSISESSLLQLQNSSFSDPTETLLNKILEAPDGNIDGVLTQLIDPNLENPAYAAAAKIQIAERNEQLRKLRSMYDNLRTERRRKRFQAENLRTQFEEREIVDAQVITDLEQAEKVVSALDKRCAQVGAAIDEAALLARAYEKIVDFCRAHPANVQSRWSLLEQEKKLAARQCDDLMKRRRQVYLLAEEIELHQKPAVQAEIDKHQQKRQQTQSAIAILRQRLQAYAQESLATTPFLTEVQEEPPSSRSGTDVVTTGRDKPPAANITANRSKHTHVRGQQERHSQRHSRAQTLQRMLGLNNAEQMFQVFMDARKLGDSLANQKKLSDTRMQQLRAEYASCKQSMADIIMVEAEDLPASPTAKSTPTTPQRADTPESQETRWLDDRYSETEMKLHQSARKAAKATSLVQQIKTGIIHLSQLLVANKKMLEHLPGAPEPPPAQSDDEMMQLLTWCEEKVVAINEALVLDTTKPKAADEAKSLHERQTALAHSLVVKKPSSSAMERPWPGKAHGVNVAGTILRSEDSYIISSPRSIRVPSNLQIDTIAEVSAKSAPEPQANDEQSNAEDAETPYEELQSFIQEAFASEESQQEIRRANILANKKLGASAGLGWAMEGVLKDIGMDRSSKPSTPVNPPRSAHSPIRSPSPMRNRSPELWQTR